MAEESPVFVVGVARSGTSALRTTLSRLPAFASRGSRLPETRIFGDPGAIPEVFERRGRRLFTYFLRDTSAAERMLTTLHQQPAPNALRRGLAAALEDGPLRGLAWRLAGRHHEVRVFFHFGRDARGAPRILEKTPHHVLFLPELFATFPRAKVVVCERHPVDAYASLRRRLARDRAAGLPPERLRWMKLGLDAYAHRYARIAAIALRAQRRRPLQCRLLRYEDLTADPRRALEELCAFLGEAFDEERLLAGRDVELDGAGGFAKGSRIARNPAAGRWRRQLEPEEARRLEDALAVPLRRLGYARYT